MKRASVGLCFIVTLRPEPNGPDAWGRDPAYRLRLFLKRALRWFGLRTLSVQDAPIETPSNAPSAGAERTQVDKPTAVAESANRLTEPVQGGAA